jgi:flagellar biosynthesis/type III secretory pathway protein FliH
LEVGRSKFDLTPIRFQLSAFHFPLFPLVPPRRNTETLPDELELEFDSEIAAFEEDRSMKYITNIERKGRAEGLAQGLAEGQAKGLAEGQAKGLAEGQAKALRQATIEILDARFGEIPYELREEIQAKEVATELQRLLRLADLAADLQAFRSQVKAA